MKMPLAVGIGLLAFAVGYGSLQAQVSTNKEQLEKRESLITDVSAMKENVKANKETALRVESELKELRAKMELDKQEILRAIKEN